MKFVLFHGSYGSSEGNWFPYLKNQLELINQDVLVPQFPIEDHKEILHLGEKKAKTIKQNLKNWLNYFKKNLLNKLKGKKDLVFVGHSLAPVFILHLVDNFNLKLDCVVFVSPFLQLPKDLWDFYLVNQTFYKTDFDFAKLKKLIPVSYVVYGNDDPYVDKKYIFDFAERMDSQTIEIMGGKHLNSEAKFLSFPLVFELCKSRLETKEYL